MANTNEPQDGAQPGVLGDGTQAQNLGQTGHPENRVTKADLDAAFETGEHGEDQPLIAAMATVEPAGLARVSDASAMDLGSSQLIDIADGGAGHVKARP